jgi:hypothetical protein
VPDEALPVAPVDVFGLPVARVAGAINMVGQRKTATSLALGILRCPDRRHCTVTGAEVVGGGGIPGCNGYEAIVLRVHAEIGYGAHLLIDILVNNCDRPSCCECMRQSAAAPTRS